jgi:amino acid transporter
VGHSSNLADSAKNAVVLGCLLILITTYLNVRGVALLAKINNIGVAAELTGAVLLIVLFFAVSRHSPVVLTQAPAEFKFSPSAFLAAALTASYVLYGFETAGSLAEETIEPRIKSPRAILLAVGSAGILGGLLISSGLMAARNPLDPALGRSDGGLARIATESFWPVVSSVFLAIVAIAIASCALTVQTGAVRLVYAMARDGLLPSSRVLSRVGGESRTPTVPAVIVGLTAMAILLLNLNHPQVVEAIGSVSVVWINLAYLFVTVPSLISRWKARKTPTEKTSYFQLGKFGLIINLAAVVWGFVIVVNTAWPRPEIYGEGPLERFLALGGTIALLILGWIYYNWVLGRDFSRRSKSRREGS